MQIDFYVTKTAQKHQAYSLIAKLAEKALASDQQLYIHCNDENQCQEVDDFLWSYQDTSFLPHEIIDEQAQPTTSIHLGWAQHTPAQPDILLNLAATVPDSYQAFKRVMEIVYEQPDVQAACRSHYKFYKTQGFEVKSHNLG
tara:strand:- start:28547 stop:28972 length:426 start_codon:yes stop_codon:yes gene_type:complete